MKAAFESSIKKKRPGVFSLKGREKVVGRGKQKRHTCFHTVSSMLRKTEKEARYQRNAAVALNSIHATSRKLSLGLKVNGT